MRSGSQPCAKGRITSQFATVMIDEAQGISRLSKEDLEMIERIAERHSRNVIDRVYRSHERIEARIEARLDELKEKLVEED